MECNADDGDQWRGHYLLCCTCRYTPIYACCYYCQNCGAIHCSGKIMHHLKYSTHCIILHSLTFHDLLENEIFQNETMYIYYNFFHPNQSIRIWLLVFLNEITHPDSFQRTCGDRFSWPLLLVVNLPLPD